MRDKAARLEEMQIAADVEVGSLLLLLLLLLPPLLLLLRLQRRCSARR
jgi:hypothetical protein